MKSKEELKAMIDGLKENYRDWFGAYPDSEALAGLLKQNLRDVVNKFIQTHVTAFDGRDTVGALGLLNGVEKVEDAKSNDDGGETEAAEAPVRRGRGRPRKTEGDVGLGSSSESSDSPAEAV